MSRRTILAASIVLFTCTDRAGATDFVWNDPAGGSFGSVFNWTPTGTPGAGDTATIALGGAYTITFANNEACDTLAVQNGLVTLDSNSIPWDLTLDSSLSVSASAQLNITDMDVVTSSFTAVNDGGSIYVLDDGRLIFQSVAIGFSASPLASVNVLGRTAAIETGAMGGGIIVAQNGATGFLSVCDGASAEITGSLWLTFSNAPNTTSSAIVAAGGTVTTDLLSLATNPGPGASADLLVLGTTSRVTVNTTMTVGATGNIPSATVRIWADAVLDLEGSANTVNETGALDLADGTLLVDHVLDVRGGTFTADATAVIDVANGAEIVASELGLIDWDQPLDVSATSVADPITFRIETGGLLEVDESCTLGGDSGTRGIVRVEGGLLRGDGGPGVFVPSTLRGAGAGEQADLWVGVGGDGELCITGGGLVQFGDDGVLAFGAGSTAVLSVRGRDVGSDVPSTLDLAAGGTAATLTVGRNGDATAEILDGARILVGGDAFLAFNPSGSADFTVDGGATAESSLSIGDDLFVGGNDAGAGGTAVLRITNGAVVTMADELLVYPSGVVTMADGSICGNTLENRGLIEGDDLLEFTLVTNTGVIDPGRQGDTPAPTDIDVSNDLVLTAAGTLRIDVFGDTPGLADKLGVGGTLDLGGTLVVGAPTGFVIAPGSSYDIIECLGPILGGFDAVITPPGLVAAVEVVGDFVRVTLNAACPADLDGSGDVGFEDLLQILSTWGPCAGGCSADLDGDRAVGFADLLLVLSAWGPCSG